MKDVEEPVVRSQGGVNSDTVIDHPAYATISASRVSGGINLFGSDFNHQHYITITVSKADLRRGLSRDWVFSGKEMIEVALSEAQWATFVSSMNAGGTPCTLQHLNQKRTVQLAAPVSRTQQFAGEHADHLKDAIREIEEATALLSISGLSAKKVKEIADKMQSAKSQIGVNLEFVAEQFEQHMEQTVESAKVEVNAYVANAIQRAGLNAIQSNPEQAVIALMGDK